MKDYVRDYTPMWLLRREILDKKYHYFDARKAMFNELSDDNIRL